MCINFLTCCDLNLGLDEPHCSPGGVILLFDDFFSVLFLEFFNTFIFKVLPISVTLNVCPVLSDLCKVVDESIHNVNINDKCFLYYLSRFCSLTLLLKYV